jgi:hypothetical protein
VSPTSRLFSFVAGTEGPWQIAECRPVVGQPLPAVPRLTIAPGRVAAAEGDVAWVLRGIVSHERYVTRPEKQQLVAASPALGRPEATCAALIPIRKNAAWWAMTQDERRRIFEEESHHTAIGLDYLPAVARRLHHCRDLGEPEPFDFLTWFEFGPGDAPAFDRPAALGAQRQHAAAKPRRTLRVNSPAGCGPTRRGTVSGSRDRARA